MKKKFSDLTYTCLRIVVLPSIPDLNQAKEEFCKFLNSQIEKLDKDAALLEEDKDGD